MTESGRRIAIDTPVRVSIRAEDFQPGFTWRGVTVVNPFDAVQHPLLREVLVAP